MATGLKRANGLERANVVFYVYALTRGPTRAAVALRGVDNVSPIESLRIGDYTCWISRVPALEFAGNLEQNMQNLDWLAAASIRHQEVVSAVATVAGDLLPARFATVFLTEGSLKKYVQRHEPPLAASFTRIEGCDEWGVKVYALARASAPVPAGAETGRQYLQRKSAGVQARIARADAEVERLARALEEISRESTSSGSVSRGQPGMIWQRAFLIPRKSRRQMEGLLADFAERWKETRRIECTGPWPPYSFVSAGGQEWAAEQAGLRR
jgi:hypothetical protein